jgi:hypothetical protein
MKNRIVFSALASVAALVIVAFFVAIKVKPVSAKDILDRAYQAQTQPAATQGIEHIRNEMFSNLEGKLDGQGMNSIIESYFDPASGSFRVVVTDKQTGQLQSVFAFDGSNAYTMDGVKSSQPGNDLADRVLQPQNRPSLLGNKFGKLYAAMGTMRRTYSIRCARSACELLGQETWENGHRFMLRSQQEIRLSAENQMAHPWV